MAAKQTLENYKRDMLAKRNSEISQVPMRPRIQNVNNVETHLKQFFKKDDGTSILDLVNEIENEADHQIDFSTDPMHT